MQDTTTDGRQLNLNSDSLALSLIVPSDEEPLLGQVSEYSTEPDDWHLYEFGVMIDAGSSGSRVHIYQW